MSYLTGTLGYVNLMLTGRTKPVVESVSLIQEYDFASRFMTRYDLGGLERDVPRFFA